MMAKKAHRSITADHAWHAAQRPRALAAHERYDPRDSASQSAARIAAAPVTRLTATDVMTGREVAELLHAPVSTVEDWARRDILPSVKIGRRRLYIRQRIEAVLNGS
jgi:excisionase family DNA binding protein